MSDALLIAIVATTIVALIVGAVTWMLVLPVRAASRNSRVLSGPSAPKELLRLLLSRPPGVPELDRALGAPEPEQLLVRWRELRERADRISFDLPGEHPDAPRSAPAEEARRIAQVLCRLGETEPRVVASAGEALPRVGLLQPLDEREWIEELASPALDPHLTAIMALLGPEIVTWHAHSPDRYGLSREQRAESLSSPPPIAELAASAARVVGVSPPVMFITPERHARLIHINLAVAGRYQSALAAGRVALDIANERVLQFMLGRKLTYMRAENLLCTEVDGPEDLLGLHRAAAGLIRPGMLPPPGATVAGQKRDRAEARLHEHLSDGARAEALGRALDAAGEQVDTRRWAAWLAATEETSFRCGLLLADDLPAAFSILEMDDVKPGNDRESELCYNALYRFFVSPGFERLRRRLTALEGKSADRT